VSSSSDKLPLEWQPPVTASPQVLSLHNNFKSSILSLKRELVRSVFYLRMISERKVYRVLGFTSIYDYAATAAGLGREQCKAFIRLGGKLQNLPQMQRALAEGTITWRKADIVVGAANPVNESELIEAARTLGEAELRRRMRPPEVPPRVRVTAARPKPVAPLLPVTISNRPPMRTADEVEHVTFRLSPEQYTRWAGLLENLNLPKEEALLSGMEALVEGKSAASGSGYLIILHHCPTCDRASLHNSRGHFEAPRALLAAGRCDGMIEDHEARRRRVVPPRIRRATLKRDSHICSVAGCGNAYNLEMHQRVQVTRGGNSTLDNLVTLCRGCHRRLHEEEEALRAVNGGSIVPAEI
jgi:5-methylcytosine-specific restriction endonuclease McrA